MLSKETTRTPRSRGSQHRTGSLPPPPPADSPRFTSSIRAAAACWRCIAPWDAAVRGHAERGLRAATAHRARAGTHADPVGRAIVQAAALWEQELFFEVHEVLEAVWQREGGDRRQALQGLIQVAVAFHHLAHGNPRGARTLLREGRARLAGSPAGTLPWADVDQLLNATAPWEAALARDAGGAVPAGPPPRLVTRREEPAPGAGG